MAHRYPTLHPTYGVSGSDMPLVVVELALIAGRSVDDIVGDEAMRCRYARAAVQSIQDRRQQVAA